MNQNGKTPARDFALRLGEATRPHPEPQKLTPAPRRFLCGLGLHNWTAWEYHFADDGIGGRTLVAFRACASCRWPQRREP